ncbi:MULTISPECIES: chorismate synthase [Burkholderia]|uniref:chorismate synthase n=1 Tax=Burkholderia TaxID=32008 RepID=UPI000BF262C2|nr:MULTISPECIES: chorismate synthase [Burkholderia]PFH20573.1 chorismate synthase [Burkholderia sp. JKS000303]
MSGNTIGKNFSVTTYGESHGDSIGCIIDGCPPGLRISEADLMPDIERRKTGRSRFVSQRQEDDAVRIMSGVLDGVTTGTPIGLRIENMNQRSKDYDSIRHLFRPGHADYTYHKKYGLREHRGGGRSSARETVVRVAAGAIAKKYLADRHGIRVRGYLAQLGPIRMRAVDLDQADNNVYFCPDPDRIDEIETFMAALTKAGDSIGARVNVIASGVPAGLGEPIFDRLDADLAHALMSISAVKGVEIGSGFASIEQHGTENRDEITPEGFSSNNAGGILGGISSGQDILASIALKPTASLHLEANTVDVDGQSAVISTHGRHDPCVGIRATPIAEAMVAIVLLDHLLRHRAQNFDLLTRQGAWATDTDN